jgi:REP element-mobilizing transposase RayT
MSRPLRLEFPGAILHITSRGNGRRDIVEDDDDRRMFLELLGEAAERFEWIVYQYTLMTNHYHTVLRLTIPESLSRGMQLLNGQYAQKFNRRHHRSGHLVQGRFDAQLVEGNAYLLGVLRYVALNPVRASMVATPDQYEWSSHRAIAGLADVPSWLSVPETLQCFAPVPEVARAMYQDFVHGGIGLDCNPWKDLVANLYLGSDAWVEQMRERVEEEPRSDDHPRSQRAPLRDLAMNDVLISVGRELATAPDSIRVGRGGQARKLTAWVASRVARLDLRSIAAGLRVASAGHVSKLISACDREMSGDPSLRESADRCIERLHHP